MKSALRLIITSLHTAADLADKLGLREAATIKALIGQIRSVEAEAENLTVRDERTPKDGK